MYKETLKRENSLIGSLLYIVYNINEQGRVHVKPSAIRR